MADYTTRVETAQRTVVAIKLPAAVVELEKAMRAAGKRAQENLNHVYDDSVMVEADEEEIRLIIVTQNWVKVQ